MKDKTTKEKTKSFASIGTKSFLSVTIILIVMIAVCGILSLVIPQGHFSRNENGEIIPDTFVKGDVKGIEFWKVITAPFRVFFVDGGTTILMISIFLK